MWVTGGDVAQQVDERFGKQDVVYLHQKSCLRPGRLSRLKFCWTHWRLKPGRF